MPPGRIADSGDGAKFLAFLKTELITVHREPTTLPIHRAARSWAVHSAGWKFALVRDVHGSEACFRDTWRRSPARHVRQSRCVRAEAAYARDHTELAGEAVRRGRRSMEPLAAPVRETHRRPAATQLSRAHIREPDHRGRTTLREQARGVQPRVTIPVSHSVSASRRRTRYGRDSSRRFANSAKYRLEFPGLGPMRTITTSREGMIIVYCPMAPSAR